MKEFVQYIVHPFKNRVLRARCRHCKYFEFVVKYDNMADAERFSHFGPCMSRVDVHGEQSVVKYVSSNAFCCPRFASRPSFIPYTASEQLSLFNNL